jgi:O-antigen ligase
MVASRAPVSALGTRPRTPQSARDPGNGVLAVVGVSIALMPLISPKGPGNTAPIDGLIALSLFTVFVWALRNRAAVRLPYVVPMTGLVLTGLASALVSVSPGMGALAVGQEIFLVLWCAAIATICRTPRALRVVVRTWALSATAWAGLLVVGVLTGLTVVVGTSDGGGARARLLFDHPNMAGNFFMVAIFIVVAAGYPARRWARVGAIALLLLAVVMTGSNAALLSLVGGAVVGLFLHIRARSGIVTATAVVALVVGTLSVSWVTVGEPLVVAAQESDNSLVRYSVGRGARSAEGRVDLFASQYDLYERGNLLGIGPAATRETLDTAAAGQVKEAHNDYLATLVERGPLGLLALVALVGVIGFRVVRVTRRPLPLRLDAAIPVPAALAGLCATFAFTAVTHEILHYRWFWTALGILAAVHLLARSDPGTAPDVRATGSKGALVRRSSSGSTSRAR